MVTGKINGGINELIQVLNDNNARSWKLVYDDERPTNATVFISDESRQREAEIERMKRVLANTTISRCYVIITSDNKNEKNQNNQIKYEWSSNSAPGAVGGLSQPNATYTPTGFSREDVDRLIQEGIDRALLQKRKDELDEREKRISEQEREFKDNQTKVGAVVVNALAPYLGGLLEPLKKALTPPRSLAVAGIANEPQNNDEEFEEQQEVDEQDPSEQDEMEEAMEDEDVARQIEASADAKRLADALKRYQEFDDKYIDVICKLVDLVTSGKPIAGMSYSTLRSLIMNL